MLRNKKVIQAKGQISFEVIALAHVRKEKGYTQKQLANKLFVDRSTLASYETLRRAVPENILRKYYEVMSRRY